MTPEEAEQRIKAWWEKRSTRPACSPRSSAIARAWTWSFVEDVATTGGSIIKAVDAINAAGAGKCQVALVVVDREEGATEACLVEGISLYPLLRKRDFGVLEGS